MEAELNRGVFVIRRTDDKADEMCIRDRDKVDVVLLGKVNGEIEALGILRVRGDDRGEVAVDDHLLDVYKRQGADCA